MLWIAHSVWRARVSSCSSNSTSPKGQSHHARASNSQLTSQQRGDQQRLGVLSVSTSLRITCPALNSFGPDSQPYYLPPGCLSPSFAIHPLCNLLSLPPLHTYIHIPTNIHQFSCPQVVAATATTCLALLLTPLLAYLPYPKSKQDPGPYLAECRCAHVKR